VEKVNPDLVARDAKGEVYTVRYDAVNAMLLNEFLKEHKAFVQEHHKVQELEKRVEKLAADMQKVTAQIQLGTPAAQMVANQK
jgi:1,4-alpha-glucan branching enzyme